MRLIFLVVFASITIGCAALEEITPVSQADAARMAEAQAADVDAAYRAAEEGNPVEALLAGGGALLCTILLSRWRRRNRIAAERVARVAAGDGSSQPAS